MDPVDPDPDSDPEHWWKLRFLSKKGKKDCFLEAFFVVFLKKSVTEEKGNTIGGR